MKLRSIHSFSTEVLLLKITCLAWFVAKIMSFKLWTADRNFPTIPTFDFLYFDTTIHLGLYIISLLGIAIIFFFPNKKITTAVFIVEILSCLLDQMRWQPWEFQYLLTLLLFLFSKDRKHFLLLFSFLMGFTYIFSGLHKFNGSFLYTFWDTIVLRKLLHLEVHTIKLPMVHYLGLIPCFIEVLIGIGIVFFRNKKYFCISAILMHLFIVLIYGPFGTNHNSIIIPWNIAMILFLVVFLFRNEIPQFKMDFFKNKLNLAVVLLIGILPILSFFNRWDNYFSFNLYSGNTKILGICAEDVQQYSELKQYTSIKKNNKYCNGAYLIKTNNWALEELKVPVFPEERAFKKLKEQFKIKYPNSNTTFVFYQYPYKKENIREVE